MNKTDDMTKFNPLQILVDGFNKIIDTVKRNGALTSLWAIVVFILLYTLIINPININDIVVGINEKAKMEHTESVNKRLIADEVIPDILEKLRLRYSLERVCLIEAHNSTTNLSSISFLYFSLVYEVIDTYNEDLEYIGDSYQQVRTSDYSSVIKTINKVGYCYIDTLSYNKQSYHDRIMKKIKSNGTNSILFCPIYDGRQIIAMLVFSSTEESFDYQQILTNMNKTAARIKSLIS